MPIHANRTNPRWRRLRKRYDLPLPAPLQPWPKTCLMNVGRAADNFSALEGAGADEFLAVSCGVSGYVPDNEEWERNRDYFSQQKTDD